MNYATHRYRTPGHPIDSLFAAKAEVMQFRDRLCDIGIPLRDYLDRSQETYSEYCRGAGTLGHDHVDGWTVRITQGNGREAAITFPCEGDRKGRMYLYQFRRTVGPIAYDRERCFDILARYLTTDMTLEKANWALNGETVAL